jgi:hypothetical protein
MLSCSVVGINHESTESRNWEYCEHRGELRSGLNSVCDTRRAERASKECEQRILAEVSFTSKQQLCFTRKVKRESNRDSICTDRRREGARNKQ